VQGLENAVGEGMIEVVLAPSQRGRRSSGVAVAALLPFAQWTSPETIGADELF
jgi:hypothetical protein